MNHGSFLIARLYVGEDHDNYQWIRDESVPFAREDAVDFLLGEEISQVYNLYAALYGQLDATLNVQMPEALLEYNRWVLLHGDNGNVVGFACFKTTDDGLKLGLIATDDTHAARAAIKKLLRNVLTFDGVYAEVSGPLELALHGHVEKVRSEFAEAVLGKSIEKLPDGFHYRRLIANIGVRTKLMVGRPHRLG